MSIKITPESVGKIALCDLGDEYRIAEAASRVCAHLIKNDTYHTFNADGQPIEGEYGALIRWKPETLRMPFRWHNIYKHEKHGIDTYSYKHLCDADKGARDDRIACIYARHWDGAEAGTFHTEADAERIRREEDV